MYFIMQNSRSLKEAFDSFRGPFELFGAILAYNRP